MMTLLFVLLLSAACLYALYYRFPGFVFELAMGLARRAARLRLRQTHVDGHDIVYLEGGQGEPLLLLHGFGANKDHWTAVAARLTKHFRVIAPDLPGFGDSTRDPHADYGLAAQLARLNAFTASLGLARFHLGGNSMGGYLAAHLAAGAPERVASLWLLAPAGAVTAEASETFAALERGENPLIATTVSELERLGALCFTRMPYAPARFMLPLAERSRREAPFNRKIFGEMFASIAGLEKVIPRCTMRTLLVWGDDDRILHPSGFERLRALLVAGDGILMPRMGHAPMLERPADAAADFLRFHGRAA